MMRTLVLIAALAVAARPSDAQLLGNLGSNELGEVLSSGDFDGDGFEDLAVASRLASWVDTAANHALFGQVNILYGTEVGLFPARQQLWDFQTLDIHPFDRSNGLGQALAAGDFDNDGYFDLAIGTPVVEFTPFGFAGSVYVIYGSADGLTKDRLQVWNPLREDLNVVPTGDDNFGDALAAGDFTGDGFTDLAIGMPKFESGDFELAGNILVLRGSSDGLSANNHQFILQPPHGNMGNDFWGEELAAGDINGDGFDELVVGMYRARIGEDIFTGAVGVLFGSPNGVTTLGYDFIRADESGVVGTAEASDWLGYSLAVADFNRDGFADLAVGIPLEDKNESGGEVAGELNQGAVLFMYGSTVGPSRDVIAEWTEAGVPLMRTEGHEGDRADFFGWDMAPGDFDGDGDMDLVVSQPGFNPGGAFNVLLSNGEFISVVGNTVQARGDEGVPGPVFSIGGGWRVLTSGDFNGDGRDDIAVGEPRDTLAGFDNAGSVTVFYGSGAGITTDGVQYFQQNTPPQPSTVLSPTDGTEVLVGGASDPIDPATPLVVIWTEAADREGLPLSYWWQVSSDAEFSDTLATVGAGLVNQLVVPLGTIGNLMTENGVGFDETVTWYHRVIAFDGVDYSVSDPTSIVLSRGLFVAAETDAIPKESGLLGSFPNPFTETATIRLIASQSGRVQVDLYDVQGSLVKSKSVDVSAHGPLEINMRRGTLAAGVYFYRIVGGGVSDVGRLVVAD